MNQEHYPPSLLAKMHRIMQSVDRIAKDRRNAQANYDYASEKAIKEALHSAFASEGILFKHEVLDCFSMEMQENSQGRETKVTVIKTRYAFIDVETGESIEGEYMGSGNGRDDKGLYAAITGSIKYVLTSSFLIPTGDDPEDDRYDYVPAQKEKPAPKPEPKKEKPKPAPEKKKEKPADPPKQAKKKAPVVVPDPEAGNVKLNEHQRDIIIQSFDQLGVEIWDLEKQAGDNRSWTTQTRKELLEVYTAITKKINGYSVQDFLDGKKPS
jgi:hypothetical protein